MADRQTLLELAKRCEKASGRLYAIERDIADALDLPGIPKNYTGSLDAAMTLVPADYLWTVGSTGTQWAFVWGDDEWDRKRRAAAATPALALTAAALRALAAMEDKNG